MGWMLCLSAGYSDERLRLRLYHLEAVTSSRSRVKFVIGDGDTDDRFGSLDPDLRVQVANPVHKVNQ